MDGATFIGTSKLPDDLDHRLYKSGPRRCFRVYKKYYRSRATSEMVYLRFMTLLVLERLFEPEERVVNAGVRFGNKNVKSGFSRELLECEYVGMAE